MKKKKKKMEKIKVKTTRKRSCIKNNKEITKR